MLVGNKCDLVKENPDERQVTTKEAEDFAKSCGLLYNETSAKTGENVKEAFESLIESKRFEINEQELIYCLAIHQGQKNKPKNELGGIRLDRIDENFKQQGGASTQAQKSDSCCG